MKCGRDGGIGRGRGSEHKKTQLEAGHCVGGSAGLAAVAALILAVWWRWLASLHL